jgi:hypothetical protein
MSMKNPISAPRMTSSPSLRIISPSAKMLRTPNAVKVKAPALIRADVFPNKKSSSGGWAAQVVHHTSDGLKHTFNFTDPMSFGRHLTKITRSEWRHPEKNEGAAIADSLDVG